MSTKTITITEEAYRALTRARTEKESFSDAVKRLAERSRPISDFGGSWEDVPETALEDVESYFRPYRKVGWKKLERMVSKGRRVK